MKSSISNSNQNSLSKNWKRYLIGSIAVIAFITIYWLFVLYPYHPKSFWGWLIFVTLGIPAYLFFEWMGEKIFSKKLFSKLSFKSLLSLVAIFLVLIIGVIIITNIFIIK